MPPEWPNPATVIPHSAACGRTSAIKLGVTFTAMTPINSSSEPLAQWSINPAAGAAAEEKSA